MKDCEILVVEDSRTQAEALRDLLQREGARVHVAASAEAALERLESGAVPELILSDIVMPGLTGYDLTRRVKADAGWRQIPVVLLTSLSDPLDIVRGLECGADNYVTKPYEAEHLIARLRHVRGQRKLQRGMRASLGINVHFLGTTFTINSEREQILDLFLSSVEDVVRTNAALEQSQLELAEAQRQLEKYARQMTERAYSSAERFRTVVEASPMAIIAVDQSRRVTLWNTAAERMLGYRTEELLLKPLDVIAAEHRESFERNIDRLRNGGTLRVESQMRHKDGRLIDVIISGSDMRDATGKLEGFMAIVEDITEQKRTAGALAESQAQLARAQKLEAIGTLAGAVAHDFNNLLTVMRGYSAILEHELPAEQEEHRHFAAEISSAADRAAALTRQLLLFSRKQVVQPEVVEADEVVGGVEAFLRRLLPANVEMRFTMQAGGSVVRVDPGQLEQVLMNLVINASQAMPLGGKIQVGTRTVRLEQDLETATGTLPIGEYVSLTVSDTGAGMDAATMKRLFEPFFTTKPAGVGTGLGLSIVRTIIEELHGGITVRSAPGQGATFEIFMPTTSERATRTTESIRQVPTGNEVVLVVEDNQAVRDTIRVALERFGYKVLDAHDGAEALLVSSMLDTPPDLLLTDLMMPQVTGRELVEQLETRDRTPKVLLMSGYADDEIIRRGLANARYPFIQKPFTREALAIKVREVLDAARSS